MKKFLPEVPFFRTYRITFFLEIYPKNNPRGNSDIIPGKIPFFISEGIYEGILERKPPRNGFVGFGVIGPKIVNEGSFSQQWSVISPGHVFSRSRRHGFSENMEIWQRNTCDLRGLLHLDNMAQCLFVNLRAG